MDREILFKAKRKDNGEWVEGYYIYHIKRTICPFGDSVKPEDEQHVIMQDGFSDWNMPRGTVVYEIDPNTLCQFTGLTDKNGQKIWENDIARDKSGDIFYVYWSEKRLNYSVKCIKSKFSIFIHQKWNLGELLKLQTEIEVCGNIFDNLELLEVA